MRTSLDLSRYSSAKLEFDRFVDDSLDSGEYLAVQVGNNGTYTQVLKWTHGSGDDDRWHHETVDLSSYLGSGFNVRFVTEQRSSSEDVAIDNFKITASSSSTPQCTLRVSALQSGGSIRTTWNSCSGVQQYKVYASENGNSRVYKGSTTGTSFTFSNPTEGKSYVMSVDLFGLHKVKFLQKVPQDSIKENLERKPLKIPSHVNRKDPQGIRSYDLVT